jgi:hypothetical protein
MLSKRAYYLQHRKFPLAFRAPSVIDMALSIQKQYTRVESRKYVIPGTVELSKWFLKFRSFIYLRLHLFQLVQPRGCRGLF